MSQAPPPIVLASTSPYRKASLARLLVAFEVADPGVDETPLPGEGPAELVARLAEAKAAAVAKRMPDSIVIAGDQVLEANGRIYGKPGDLATARAHLLELSGQRGTFHSGMCVTFRGERQAVTVRTEATWRELDERTVDSYLEKEPSPHSAGAAQLEGLGISLLERLECYDPSAILGVPLISLCDMLGKFGVKVP